MASAVESSFHVSRRLNVYQTHFRNVRRLLYLCWFSTLGLCELYFGLSPQAGQDKIRPIQHGPLPTSIEVFVGEDSASKPK